MPVAVAVRASMHASFIVMEWWSEELFTVTGKLLDHREAQTCSGTCFMSCDHVSNVQCHGGQAFWSCYARDHCVNKTIPHLWFLPPGKLASVLYS